MLKSLLISFSLVIASLVISGQALAQNNNSDNIIHTVSPSTLDEMKAYFQSQPACLKDNSCYVWEQMDFNHQGKNLIVSATLNNTTLDEINLPFNANQLNLTQFNYQNLDNNKEGKIGLMRNDGVYVLGANPGRYSITMNFNIADSSRISLDKIWKATGNIIINNTSHEAQVSVEKQMAKQDNTQKQYNLNDEVMIEKHIILNGTRWIASTTLTSTQDMNLTLPLFVGEHALNENQLDSSGKNISVSLSANEPTTIESFFLPDSHILVPSMNYPIHVTLQGSELYQAKKIENNANIYSITHGQDNDYWLYSKQKPLDIEIQVQKAIVKDTTMINQYEVDTAIEQDKLVATHSIVTHSTIANQLNFTTAKDEIIRSVSLNNQPINYATIKPHTYSVSIDASESQLNIVTERAVPKLYIPNPFFQFNVPIYNQIWKQNTDGLWAVLATGSYHSSIAWVGVLLCMLILSFFVSKKVFPMGVIASFVLLFGAMQGGLPLIALMIITFALIQFRSKSVLKHYFWFNVLQIAIALLVITTFYLVIDSIHMSLILNHPNLYMSNLDDTNNVLWFSAYHAHIGGLLYLPLWLYKVIMLLWTFWFAYLIIDRAKWGWSAYSSGNIYWKNGPKKVFLDPSQVNNKSNIVDNTSNLENEKLQNHENKNN